MHLDNQKFKIGHRMGIYYCCDIYVGGIGDTLRCTQGPAPNGDSLKAQLFYYSPPPINN